MAGVAHSKPTRTHRGELVEAKGYQLVFADARCPSPAEGPQSSLEGTAVSRLCVRPAASGPVRKHSLHPRFLLVFCGAKPAAMPEKELEAVKILVRSGATLAPNPQLYPGQRVQVTAGPFMGVQGELVRYQSRDRLVINAHLLSSSVSVEVDLAVVSVL
jgi:hypothetical protein